MNIKQYSRAHKKLFTIILVLKPLDFHDKTSSLTQNLWDKTWAYYSVHGAGNDNFDMFDEIEEDHDYIENNN